MPDIEQKIAPNYQDIDMHVGRKIRQLRIELGLTQQQLAGMIGVTFQQAHKYERGLNRISAGRLFEIARVLGVELNYFFIGLAGEDEAEAERTVLDGRQRLCLEVSRNFANITNERHQKAVSSLCRLLADNLEV